MSFYNLGVSAMFVFLVKIFWCILEILQKNIDGVKSIFLIQFYFLNWVPKDPFKGLNVQSYSHLSLWTNLPLCQASLASQQRGQNVRSRHNLSGIFCGEPGRWTSDWHRSSICVHIHYVHRCREREFRYMWSDLWICWLMTVASSWQRGQFRYLPRDVRLKGQPLYHKA